MYFCYINSPVGRLLLAGEENALKRISFETERYSRQPPADWRHDGRLLRVVIHQLHDYFACKRQRFDLTLQPDGTSFQNSVWQALLDVPYGETQSYGDIARRIARPQAVRAVGAANAANPLPIVVPCHRIVGTNGKLTGYGGGLDIKRKLLSLERQEETLF